MRIKNIIVVIFIVSLGSILNVCSEDTISVPKENDSDPIQIEPGILHNEILDKYNEYHFIFGEKLTHENGIDLFVEVANHILIKNDIDYSIDKNFVKDMISRFKTFRNESGYDILNPGSDLNLAFDYLESNSEINYENIRILRNCFKDIRKGEYIKPTEPWLIVKCENLDDPVVNIGLYSTEWWYKYYEYMDEYVKYHPELKGWWDRWKKRIREWGLIGTDCLGAIVASPSGPVGAIIGGALASIAYTIAWPPDM
ncbi:MAG: hypothetical protein JSV33_15090 [bacterium]|nr:MAG: hypothetical protein JSV33_15090 [bacterium]